MCAFSLDAGTANARALLDSEQDNLPCSDDELPQVFSPLQSAYQSFANLYFCSNGWHQQLQKRLYCTILPDVWFSADLPWVIAYELHNTTGVSLILQSVNYRIGLVSYPTLFI